MSPPSKVVLTYYLPSSIEKGHAENAASKIGWLMERLPSILSFEDSPQISIMNTSLANS